MTDDILPEYAELAAVMRDVLDQIAAGKGHQRHGEDGVPFEEQPMAFLRKLRFCTGQAIKKLIEAERLDEISGDPTAGERERIGAIGYVLGEILLSRKERG